MVQLKKKAVLLIGALMLLLGMGMNLQYALNDYGLAENKAVNQVLLKLQVVQKQVILRERDGLVCI